MARASALLYLRARARSWPSIADEPEQGRAMVVGGWAGRVYTQPPPSRPTSSDSLSTAESLSLSHG